MSVSTMFSESLECVAAMAANWGMVAGATLTGIMAYVNLPASILLPAVSVCSTDNCCMSLCTVDCVLCAMCNVQCAMCNV